MSLYESDNKYVTCPYDEAHRMKASRLQLHIVTCRLDHLDAGKVECPLNATHIFSPSERDFHLLNCPDSAPVDRSISQNALDKNNPFKGRTAVPTFPEPLNISNEGAWDAEPVDGFQPNTIEPPPGAMIEPVPMSKPAERRRLYKELHTYPSEADNENKSAPKPSPVPRQPKQPSETQKLQNVSQQASSETIQNLGLGRGRSNRIAANIFENTNVATTGANSCSYSNIVKDMGNLGLGRGTPVNQNPIPFLDNEDFPPLGCGRGVMNAPKQSLRTPGVKPKK